MIDAVCVLCTVLNVLSIMVWVEILVKWEEAEAEICPLPSWTAEVTTHPTAGWWNTPAVRWSEASSELREQAVQVFQLQVRLLGTHFQLLVSMTLANIRMCYSAFSCLLFSYLDNRGVLHPLLPKYTPLSMFQRLLHPHKSHGMQSWSVFTNYYQTVIHMQVYSNQLCNSDTHGG